MSALGLAFRAALALGVVTAAIVAPSSAAEPDLSRLMTTVSGGMVKNLQLGVGKSVIVDLPEEASEIYVGDPRIANAVVRTAKRIYVSAIANGQTTIFALGRDGRKIAIVEVSVGRDVGELTNLLNASNSRQRYPRPHRRQFDHPDRFGRVGRRRPEGYRHRVRVHR